MESKKKQMCELEHPNNREAWLFVACLQKVNLCCKTSSLISFEHGVYSMWVWERLAPVNFY